MLRRHWTRPRTAAPVVAAVLVAGLLGAVVTGCGSSGGDSTADTTAATGPPLADVGSPITVEGLTVTVAGTETRDAINLELLKWNFLLAHVEIVNEGDRAHPFGPTDWTFEATGGVSIEAAALGDDTRLTFGTLDPGDRDAGDVAFDLGAASAEGIIWYIANGARAAGWRVAGS